MTVSINRNKALALSAIGAFIATVTIATAGDAGSTTSITAVEGTGPYCEVLASPTGNLISLEAIFHTDVAAQASYRFSVNSVGGPGNVNINQGGGATLPEAGTFSLGKVTVSDGSDYNVALDVQVGDDSYSCGGRTGA